LVESPNVELGILVSSSQGVHLHRDAVGGLRGGMQQGEVPNPQLAHHAQHIFRDKLFQIWKDKLCADVGGANGIP